MKFRTLVVFFIHLASSSLCVAQSRPALHTQRLHDLQVLQGVGGIIPSTGEPVKCGLPVITAALHNRAALDAARSAALANIMVRPETQTSVLAGKFKIHFDTTGIDAPTMLDAFHQPIHGTARQFADSVASILSFVYSFETGTLGYDPPPQDGTIGGGPEYDVYIADLGNLYGVTNTDSAIGDGGTSTTFITIDNDFIFVNPPANKGLPAARVTLAHEFHHAIQIGSYGYWTTDPFFYEITSTWLEGVLFPEVKDYYNYLQSPNGQFKHPEVSFTTSNGLIEYSRAIWGHFIAKRFGRDAMRKTWEQIRASRPITAIDAMLQQYSSGLASAFSEWALWNHFTGSRSDSTKYYPEGAAYPPMFEWAIEYLPPSRTIVGPAPLEYISSAYHQIISQNGTLTVIVSNTNFAPTLSGATGSNPYVILLSSSRPDNSYVLTDTGIYCKLQVADPAYWQTWPPNLAGGPVLLAETTPFPNPFRPDGSALMSIPVTTSGVSAGTLNIYTSNMDLVCSISEISRSWNGRQVFEWDGRNNDKSIVSSGVYLFVLSLVDRTITGKLAVIRH